MNTSKAFGLVLKQLRMDAELTQNELADLSGYSKNYIGLLERGQRQPTLQTIIDLSKSLQISSADFVKRVERRLTRT